MTAKKFSEISHSQETYLFDLNKFEAIYVKAFPSNFVISSFLDTRMDGFAKMEKFALSPLSFKEEIGEFANEYIRGFIFHMGHVGSTLVSRAVGLSSTCLSLREPLPLRFLAKSKDEIPSEHAFLTARQFDFLLNFTLMHLDRPVAK